jgi:hypothetical protein
LEGTPGTVECFKAVEKIDSPPTLEENVTKVIIAKEAGVPVVLAAAGDSPSKKRKNVLSDDEPSKQCCQSVVALTTIPVGEPIEAIRDSPKTKEEKQTWRPVELSLTTPDVSRLPGILKWTMVDLLSNSEDVVVAALGNIQNHYSFTDPPYPVFPAATVVGVMIRWYDSEEIQATAGAALANTAQHPMLRQDALRVGALETVLLAMKNFPRNERVQLFCTGAIVNLSCDNAESTMTRLLNGSAFLLVTTAMKSFPDDRRLQRWACQFLSNAAGRKHLRRSIIDAGALETIGTAIRKCSADKQVQKIGKQAMQRLTAPE